MMKALIAVCVGASAGAVLRWGLSVQFNTAFPAIPPGTLLSNVIGGYVVGLAIAYFAAHPGLSPEWRLLIITGFCGGLTTFSTFSAELAMLLREGQALLAFGAIAVHVVGSVIATFAGMATMTWLKN